MHTLDKDDIIASLRDEVEALRTIISLTPGNVYWKDRHSKYLGCNKQFAHILKLPTPDDIIGLSDEELMAHVLNAHPKKPGNSKYFVEILKSPQLENLFNFSNKEQLAHYFAEEIHKIDNKVMATNQEHCQEEIGLTADGSPATYLTRKTPLFDRHGDLQGILGISFDISDRKKIEHNLKVAKKKAEAANLAKSRFLAMISHELRTPLTSILGFANLLEQGQLNDSQKQAFTRHIKDSGSYLLSLINNLLDYNKLETNKYEFTRFPVNLRELTDSVVSMLNVTASEKQLLLKLEYSQETPALILSNHRILRQILINLIGNAIKFTQKGHVIARVTCKKATDAVATLEIAVEDTGCGIAAEEQQMVFKHFTQLGNVYTRTKSLAGTGLGLAIVKKLVKLLGGKIRVKSKLNKGSTFYVTCPFPTLAAEDAPWLPYTERVKILAIQHHENDTTLHTLLTHTFYDTVNANEIMETALATQLSLQPYDILLFDQQAAAQASDLQKAFNEKSDYKRPLLLCVSADSTHSAEGIDTTLPVTPGALDIKKFQQALTIAWETWLTHANKPRKQATSHPRVLLIEDNELIQIIHKHMLEELGCQVDVSDSANNALRMLDQRYDMLFVDIGLPDIAGFDLIKKIRQQDDQLNNVPIVVLTGYSEEAERQRCLEAGADEVAIKPVSKEILGNILKRYVSA